MSTKHTAGPWTVGNADDCAREHAICAGPYVIARVTGSGYPQGIGWGPDTASNARLIAAAPELLEALRALVDATPTPLHNRAQAAAFTQACAALAKARGD